ncbi:MAG: hypothetical protein HY782_22945 [Chloroflexi bacterium]|nr:hypothetical protein [Chloroflexota bacterium]
MNLNGSHSNVVRVFLFAVLVTLLTSFSLSTVQSHQAETIAAPTRTSGGAPALKAPSAPFVYFFPFIAKAPTLDLTISTAKVIQGTTLSGNYSVYIANRPTTVRAFVAVNEEGTVANVVGRMDIYNASASFIGSVTSNSSTAPSIESSMNRTLNFNVPANLLSQAASYSITVNPNDTIAESNNGNNTWPGNGTRAAFNFVAESPLEVVIVPILYLPKGAQFSTLPNLGNVSNLLWLADAVYPVPNINYTIHANWPFEPASVSENLNQPSGAGWQALLDSVTALHAMENEDPGGTKVYYGLVNVASAHNGCGGCITGLGWVGLPTAVGWSGNPDGSSSQGETFAHEVGHAFGREHALCTGQETYPDPNYPYSGGSIGVWGLDVDTGWLYDPYYYADYMSYCTLTWTSDYTYAGIKSFRDSQNYAPSRLSTQAVPALYVSGSVAPTGEISMYPIYRQTARVNVPSSGTHTLELVGNGGVVLASYAFTPARSPDARGWSGFGFFVPAVDGLTGIRVTTNGRIVGEKTVGAPLVATELQTRAPTTQRAPAGTDIVLSWGPATHPTESVVYRVRISRDGGATWQVLALDLRRPQFQIPPGVDLANTLVEIQASDGIHTTTRVFSP